ncbi:Uncharacterised protein [Raoultella terrigena]|uniref:Uncharacterized protein n=1 Tax=Raoultella terrigena TaxID=577 RepID=A0A3P8M4J5_RAOTE|nr:Uncharacterised protein [Raoultella terrigena]
MSALRIELKKSFTNEGVVHELSWIPGVQTGGVLCSILSGKGIDLRQKTVHPTQTFTFPPCFMQILTKQGWKNHLGK